MRAVVWAVTLLAATANANSTPLEQGAALYDKLCLPCHGEKGDGNGPAAPWLWPRPRDFSRGQFKWRTTPSGAAATEDDLALAIRFGVNGTSMPGFAKILPESDIAALSQIVVQFAKSRQTAKPLSLTKPQLQSERDQRLQRGKVLYTDLGCAQCHGTSGKGDGPSANALVDDRGFATPPYDLTRNVVRRPGQRSSQDELIFAIYQSLVTGLNGTPMPSYQEAASPADLWSVAEYVESLAPDRPSLATPWENRISTIHPLALDYDTKKPTHAGFWYGDKASPDAKVFGSRLTPQNTKADFRLTPAQASLSAKQCARCHAKQAAEWKGSLHGTAMSPGILAQLITMEQSPHGGATLESCQRCHAPLVEQSPLWPLASNVTPVAKEPYGPNQHFRSELREEGVNCAACHVRNNGTRLGPPAISASLLAIANYPREELPIYERSDFCAPCHQLEPRNSIAAKPTLNTYREWLEGPYMQRGVQCQNCHMPNREHSWKGIHDPETVRQALQVNVFMRDVGNGIAADLQLTNVGAGHFLPTTPTPAIFVHSELVDNSGAVLANTTQTQRIGRELALPAGNFRELSDTRIPPGESLMVHASWKNSADASAVQVRIEVWPDDFYEGFYERQLQRKVSGLVKELFTQALNRARQNRYVLSVRQYPLGKKKSP